MNELFKIWSIVCPLVFLAGFVDSIAGGGGLISLPAYLLAGLPAHTAAGTNKLAASVGTLCAAVRYIRAGKIDIRVSLLAALGSFGGAALGSSLALMVSDAALKLLMLAALPAVAVFLIFRRDFGKEGGQEKELPERKRVLFSVLIGLGIGCYDGLIGPGTGTFLLLAFTAVMGFDLLKSTGCAKVANLASNLASILVFLIGGKIYFAVALPAAACTAAGSLVGTKLALAGGSRYVRYVVFMVLGILFVKTAWGFFA
ncbi:TSUP family transporter [Papillibacter cinnamivorans]|uniref:Probable membrane transporter protein n=1 Tax=Papillibacter cinnamivorans DSM 12816 TaxID=1122930 RepID=A0A1W2CUB2_9FIRM|nr:TSUP family transporter [Papillibacter cinnamivorans]SMC88825.1 hypothetical protein SAMN02745168_0230 [Papillibacter cinnamivorans DSM 12816]